MVICEIYNKLYESYNNDKKKLVWYFLLIYGRHEGHEGVDFSYIG